MTDFPAKSNWHFPRNLAAAFVRSGQPPILQKIRTEKTGLPLLTGDGQKRQPQGQGALVFRRRSEPSPGEETDFISRGIRPLFIEMIVSRRRRLSLWESRHAEGVTERVSYGPLRPARCAGVLFLKTPLHRSFHQSIPVDK